MNKQNQLIAPCVEIDGAADRAQQECEAEDLCERRGRDAVEKRAVFLRLQLKKGAKVSEETMWKREGQNSQRRHRRVHVEGL